MKINNLKTLAVELTPLPFKDSYLEPYMSKETIHYHYNKHHQNYVNKTISLIGEQSSRISLMDVIMEAKSRDNKILYNNSGQVLNHHIFWLSLQNGVQSREQELIEAQWGSYHAFRSEFINQGMAQFGSGWIWLLRDGHKMFIQTTSNGDIPDQVLYSQVDVVTICDLWEHAYYIDYRNERNRFLEVFVDHLMKLIV